MNIDLRDGFLARWAKYFPGSELPLAFYYTSDGPPRKPPPDRDLGPCLVAHLQKARRGETLCVGAEEIGCPGGRRYLGFAHELRPGFEHFLSCGIPGKISGERYKKSPELVLEMMKRQPKFVAPAPWAVFKRWDTLGEADSPAVVIFVARADALAGLFTLANFDAPDAYAVIAPFSAGCGSIVEHPYREGLAARPHAVLGMFDISARPYFPADTLSFSVPWPMFERMAANMDESFLITGSWAKVQARMQG